jgi:hypothetical protein
VIASAPPGSAALLIAAYSQPFVDSGNRIMDETVATIVETAVHQGLGGAFADTDGLRKQVADVVVPFLREWLVQQLIEHSAIHAEEGHTDDEAS